MFQLLSLPHTHTHTYCQSLIRYTLAVEFAFIHIHTNRRWLHPGDKKFFLSEEISLLLPPAGNTRLFIDQGLAGERARARDEEKRERGEKILQL